MKGRLLFAIVLLVVGGVWLLDVSGREIFPGGFGTWWPSILVLIGLVQLVFAGRQWRGPFVLIVVGAILQAWQLDYIPDDWWKYAAPLALILLAVLLLLPPYPKWRPQDEAWRGHVHHPPRPGHLGPEDVAVFSEQHLAPPPGSEYRGGELTAVFGSLDADLTKATLPPRRRADEGDVRLRWRQGARAGGLAHRGPRHARPGPDDEPGGRADGRAEARRGGRGRLRQRRGHERLSGGVRPAGVLPQPAISTTTVALSSAAEGPEPLDVPRSVA